MEIALLKILLALLWKDPGSKFLPAPHVGQLIDKVFKSRMAAHPSIPKSLSKPLWDFLPYRLIPAPVDELPASKTHFN